MGVEAATSSRKIQIILAILNFKITEITNK